MYGVLTSSNGDRPKVGKMKLRDWFNPVRVLLLAAVLVIVACGGSGGGDTLQDDPAYEWALDYRGAMQTENLTRVSDLFADTFLDNCTDKTEVLNNTSTLFAGTTELRIEILEVAPGSFSSGNTIYSALVRFRVAGNSVTGPVNYTETGTLVLRKFDGLWYSYGNQTCLAGAVSILSPRNLKK